MATKPSLPPILLRYRLRPCKKQIAWLQWAKCADMIFGSRSNPSWGVMIIKHIAITNLPGFQDTDVAQFRLKHRFAKISTSCLTVLLYWNASIKASTVMILSFNFHAGARVHPLHLKKIRRNRVSIYGVSWFNSLSLIFKPHQRRFANHWSDVFSILLIESS